MGDPRICVVGTGRWGQNHVRTLYGLRSLGGIVEPRASVRGALTAQYGVVGFATLEESLAQDFDGYVVAVPAKCHYEMARQLILAGKPLLVEKPMTLEAKESEELVELARARRVPLMVGHLLLFHPAIRVLRAQIERGAIGRLYYLYSNRLNLGRVRSEENAFWSLAPHDISLFEYFVGAQPMRVRAAGSAFLQPGIPDKVLAVLEYPGGVSGHIFASWLHPFKEHRLVLVGAEGMLVYEDSSAEKQVLLYRSGCKVHAGEPELFQAEPEVLAYEPAQPLTEELRYFMAHLGGGVEVASGESGLRTVRVLQEVQRQLEEA